MCLNDILENEELKKLLNSSIEKTYYTYHLSFIIEKDDFEQEVYIYLIKRIKSFDNEKSSLRTFIPLVVMSCAKHSIQMANGQSKKCNKLEFRNNTLSLDYEIDVGDNNKLRFYDMIGDSMDNIDQKLLVDDILKMHRLSRNEKEILQLMYEGYTKTEIGELMHKSTTNINMTFQRAKEKIVRRYAR